MKLILESCVCIIGLVLKWMWLVEFEVIHLTEGKFMVLMVLLLVLQLGSNERADAA